MSNNGANRRNRDDPEDDFQSSGANSRLQNNNNGYRNNNRRGGGRSRGGRGRGGGPGRLPDERQPSGNVRTQQRQLGFAASTGGSMLNRTQLAAVKPLALSTSSEDKNDPMIKAGFIIQGSVALSPSDPLPTFKLDYSQYITLARTSYNTISRVDRGFAKNICESAYVYYAVVLLWRRLMHILSERAEYVVIAQTLQLAFNHCKIQIPKDLGIYLSGIGNITDFCSRKSELSLNALCTNLSLYGARGSFGLMDENNHIHYETIPSPLIALLTIMEDMRVTNNPDGNANWELPADLRPAVANTFLPNRNLLGWRPARPLSDDQLREIRSCGFVLDQSFGDIRNPGNIPLQYDLLLVVSEALNKAKAPVSDPETGQFEGSVGQVLFNCIETQTIFRRDKATCSEYACTKSSHQAGPNITASSVAFRYRIQRSTSATDARCVCYLDADGEAPIGWINQENAVFEAAPPTWNTTRFTGQTSYGVDAAQAVSDAYLARPT